MNPRLIAVAMLCASPAFACGPTTEQVVVMGAVAAVIGIAAVLLAERVIFSLAMRTFGMARQHRPSGAGPLLYLAGIFTTLAAWAWSENTIIVVALPVTIVGAVIIVTSFVKSLRRELRGHAGAMVLRVTGVGVVVMLPALFFGALTS